MSRLSLRPTVRPLALGAALLWGVVEWIALSRSRWTARGR